MGSAVPLKCIHDAIGPELAKGQIHRYTHIYMGSVAPLESIHDTIGPVVAIGLLIGTLALWCIMNAFQFMLLKWIHDTIGHVVPIGHINRYIHIYMGSVVNH